MGEGNSRYQLLFALEKVQDQLVEKVLRRALDPDFNFSDNPSLTETEPGGELGRRTNTWTAWQYLQGYRAQIVSARCIRIPAEGEPVSEIVDFRVGDWLDSVKSIAPSGIAPSIWMGSKRPMRISDSSIEKGVYSEQQINSRMTIKICARQQSVFYTPDDKINEWYRDLIRAFHKYSIDSTGTACRWRGDLYVYRTSNKNLRVLDTNWHTELDSIERKEMMEVVQKCRDELAASWEDELEFIEQYQGRDYWRYNQ